MGLAYTAVGYSRPVSTTFGYAGSEIDLAYTTIGHDSSETNLAHSAVG